MVTVVNKAGLEGISAGESAICQIDEEKGGLQYRGYRVEDLAEQASFEEVAYLLLMGELPSHQELQAWKRELDYAGFLPDPIPQVLRLVPATAHLMDTLRTGVSLLGMMDSEANNASFEANVHKATRLIARLPLILSLAFQSKQDKHQPISAGTCAENLLYLLTGTRDKANAKELEVSLILYAEHEFNASTFAARVTASTWADLYGGVTSAIATLKGPSHGGANEAVAEMLVKIERPEKAKAWVLAALDRKERVMGFGHRVLKLEDPRSVIMKRRAKALSENMGEMRWYEMAEIMDQTMQEEKGLLPNLDFYTAVVYLLLKLPIKTYTPIFVTSRVAGWCAHIIEQQANNRIMRPRATYIGPPTREYLPIQHRSSRGTIGPGISPPDGPVLN